MKMAVLFSLLGLSGCVHYYPAQVSTTSMGDPYEQPVKVTYGQSSAYYVFGFIGPLGDDSLHSAVQDAMSDAPSDSMINTYVDRKVTTFPFDFLPIVSRIDTHVFGTLVKYNFPARSINSRVESSKPLAAAPAPVVVQESLSDDVVVQMELNWMQAKEEVLQEKRGIRFLATFKSGDRTVSGVYKGIEKDFFWYTPEVGTGIFQKTIGFKDLSELMLYGRRKKKIIFK